MKLSRSVVLILPYGVLMSVDSCEERVVLSLK